MSERTSYRVKTGNVRYNETRDTWKQFRTHEEVTGRDRYSIASARDKKGIYSVGNTSKVVDQRSGEIR